jgi:hypothetical protein
VGTADSHIRLCDPESRARLRRSWFRRPGVGVVCLNPHEPVVGVRIHASRQTRKC